MRITKKMLVEKITTLKTVIFILSAICLSLWFISFIQNIKIFIDVENIVKNQNDRIENTGEVLKNTEEIKNILTIGE